jgi:acyl-CoA hydrolase
MDRATMTLRFLAAPTDAGYPGHVSAGRVLEWIDKAGYACAVAWSGSYSVTAYVGNVSFTRPVQVGDIVEATARIVQTGAQQHEHPGHRPIWHHRVNPAESVDRVLDDFRCDRR